jgi:hypothetical protein
MVAPGNTKSTSVQTGELPGLQKFPSGVVFLKAHIFALYLPGATRCVPAQAIAPAPQLLSSHWSRPSYDPGHPSAGFD